MGSIRTEFQPPTVPSGFISNPHKGHPISIFDSCTHRATRIPRGPRRDISVFVSLFENSLLSATTGVRWRSLFTQDSLLPHVAVPSRGPFPFLEAIPVRLPFPIKVRRLHFPFGDRGFLSDPHLVEGKPDTRSETFTDRSLFCYVFPSPSSLSRNFDEETASFN